MQTISLENECTIYEVAEKQQQIIEQWPKQNSPIAFDLAAVTEIDICFLQLLISCKKTASQNNVDCDLINPSDEVITKIKAAYLSDALL